MTPPLSRGYLTTLLHVDGRDVVSAVDASDDLAAQKTARELEQKLAYLGTAATEELRQLVVDIRDLARTLWSDTEEDPSLDDLLAAAQAIEDERHTEEAQIRDGIRQSRMF